MLSLLRKIFCVTSVDNKMQNVQLYKIEINLHEPIILEIVLIVKI